MYLYRLQINWEIEKKNVKLRNTIYVQEVGIIYANTTMNPAKGPHPKDMKTSQNSLYLYAQQPENMKETYF
jgi:hypothetical protein